MVSQEKRGQAAILMASDRNQKETEGMARRKLTASGHKVVDTRTLPSDKVQVEKQLKQWANQGIQVVVCIGGTGYASRDNTIEGVEAVIEKDIPGFGELFRVLTYKKWKHTTKDVGVLAMDTRAKAGIRGKTIIYAVPSSPDAVKLALEKLILPETPYLMGQLAR